MHCCLALPLSISTTSRAASIGSMSSPFETSSVFRVFIGLASALLCHTRFPAAKKCSQYWFLWTSLLCSNRIEDVVFDVVCNEVFSSVPTHQSFEMHPHCMANFAAHWNHETAVGCQIEILSPFARKFSTKPQHIVCTSESSVQRSTQTFFIVTLKLPSSTVRDTLTGGCSIEPPISCSIWTEVQWTCVHRSPCVQVHLHPLKPSSDCSRHQDQNFQLKVSLRNCHRFDPNLYAIQPNSNHHFIHRNSSHHHTMNCPCENCQYDTSVQIPEFLNLTLIWGFQDPKTSCRGFTLVRNLGTFGTFGFSLLFLLCPLTSLCLVLFTFAGRLLLRGVAVAFACMAVSLKMCSTVLETTISWTR